MQFSQRLPYDSNKRFIYLSSCRSGNLRAESGGGGTVVGVGDEVREGGIRT